MSDFKLFDQFQDSILVVDSDGHALYANVAATILLDVSAKRLSGRKPLQQFVTFDPNPFEQAGGIAGVTDVTPMREVNFSSSSGKEGSVQVTLLPVPDYFPKLADGKGQWIVYLRDVSLEKTLADKYRAELDQKEVMINDLKAARAQLEDYSRNLEKKVEDRTVELREANALLKTILDSLGQGILVFGRDGTCLPIHSQICREMFGVDPAGLKVDDVLKLDPSEDLAMWRETVFAEMLSFEELVPLAPSRLALPPPTEISLGYNLMRDSQGQTSGIVVVATDRTSEMKALREAQRERDLVRRVVQVAKHREAFRMFVSDARSVLDALEGGPISDLAELQRRLHTLKGGAATFALSRIVEATHHLEDEVRSVDITSAEWVSKQQAEATKLRAWLEEDVQSLSELLGPLSGNKVAVVEVPSSLFQEWAKRLASIEASSPEKVRRELSKFSSEILRAADERPVGDALRHYETSLQELAARLGKKLEKYSIEGAETRVPLKRLQPLFASFVHALRNSIDHGFETPEERLKRGKLEGGSLAISIARTDDRLQITIADDGGGVNVERVRAKLAASGRDHLVKLAAASDEEVTQAILLSDLSTAEAVTDVSGRGVGLNAVAEEAEKLGGHVRVVSTFGQGMRLEIDVPLNAEESLGIVPKAS